MTFVIPQKTKNFKVDNASMSRGNIYSTFNVMFDADIGRVKLNPAFVKLYDTTSNSDFVNPFAFALASADSSSYGSALDCYVLGTNFLWSTLFGLVKVNGADAPGSVTDATSDVCLFLGAQTSEKLYVSDSAGLHHCDPKASLDTWDTPLTTSEYQSNFILVPFTDTNRLYMFKANSVMSVEETSAGVYSSATSGSYTIVGGLSNISCARAGSKRIWFASSGNRNSKKSKVYEWDGVQTNPLNIIPIDTDIIQSIAILDDVPVVIDGKGRLWFYDGNNFILKDGVNLPTRQDDNSTQTCVVHRNGMIADRGKLYILVGSYGDGIATKNTTERALAGIWCYDPAIGLYHFSAPENMSVITVPLALSRHSLSDFICGYTGLTTSVSGPVDRISISDRVNGVGDDATLRTGFITTQFMESKNLTDAFNTIAVKYRDMIYSAAKIEVKYRSKKNIECNATITWTSATTFTVSTATLAGTGTYYNTQVAVGDEVMVQQGANVGLIAHIVSLQDISGTTTVTIDRSATLTSGTSYAMFANYTLLGSVTPSYAFNFKNFRLGKSLTMLQVKVVMQWKGYYDELQEILVPEQVQEKTT